LLKPPSDIDMVIHCGDHSNSYDPFINELELRKSLAWFESLPIKYKLSTVGNHDCYHKDTLFLTNKGFLRYEEIDDTVSLATFDDENNITYEKYLEKFEGHATELVDICSHATHQIVTKNHKIYYKNELIGINDNVVYNDNHFVLSGKYNTPEYDILDDELKLINFVLSDSTIVFKENKLGKYLSRIQFKLSKTRKIKELCFLLESLGIKYTKQPCKKSGINKLDPFYIRIYGVEAREIYDNLLLKAKQIPDYFRLLSVRQKRVFLDYFSLTDGNLDDNNATVITTINEDLAKKILELCLLAGYDCYYQNKESSGFKNGKTQYHIRICRNRLKGHGNTIQPNIIPYNDKVVCFSVPSKKLITMLNGKIAFSGNSSFQGGAKSLVKPEEYPGITFLMHEEKIIEGIKFFGSPYTPVYGNWSFTYKRNKGQQVWECIPKDTDILFTHGMPKHRLDLAEDENGKGIVSVGCKSLLNRILDTNISLCIGGHLHDSLECPNYGVLYKDSRYYINAACYSHRDSKFYNGFTLDYNDGKISNISLA
jgi:predicted phosphodiesterase